MELDILLVVHVLLDDFQWCTTYVVGPDSQSHDLGSISQSRLRYQLEETLGNLNPQALYDGTQALYPHAEGKGLYGSRR